MTKPQHQLKQHPELRAATRSKQQRILRLVKWSAIFIFLAASIPAVLLHWDEAHRFRHFCNSIQKGQPIEQARRLANQLHYLYEIDTESEKAVRHGPEVLIRPSHEWPTAFACRLTVQNGFVISIH